MMSIRWRQLISFIGGVAAIGVSTFVSQHVWREGGIRSLQAVNEQRVQLVANALTAEVGRQDHLPVVLSLDADVRSALAAPDAERIARLDRKLTIVSHEADTRALYVIAPNGTVLASDDWDCPQTLVGRNLAERPYFVKAAASGKSSYLGVEPDSDRVRYYLAEAVRDGSRLLGIAVVRIEFDALEAAWERAAERVLITDSEGIASSRAIRPTNTGRWVRHRRSSAPMSTWPGAIPACWRRRSIWSYANAVARISIVQVKPPIMSSTYLYQSMQLPAYGWTIHRLTDLASAREDQRDGAIIGGATSALIISLPLYVMQRHRAYVSQREAAGRLKGEVAERTRELSASNASLQTEIDEHRRTESRLRATQNELVQAGKLAALGQMSAAHRPRDQPAARRHPDLHGQRQGFRPARRCLPQMLSNLDLITDLAERMASITGHLKTFARKSEPGHPEPVLVDRAVERALFLLESQIKAAGIRIEKKVAPELWVLGDAGPARAGHSQPRAQRARCGRGPGRWLDPDHRARIRRYGVHRRIR